MDVKGPQSDEKAEEQAELQNSALPILDIDRPKASYVVKRKSLVWTDDEENGLPGSPQVEDFFRPMPKKKIAPELLSSFSWFGTVSITTFFLLFITVVDWNTSVDTFAAGSNVVFVNKEYENLFLSMFSHGDAAHLFSNLFGFVGFGYLLKKHFGFFAFPVVPLLNGIITTLLTISLMPPEHTVIGSSGIVFSQVGLYVTLYFLFERRYSLVLRLLRVVGFMLVLFFPHEYSESTSYLSHAIGFALGVAGAFVLRPYIASKIAAANRSRYKSFQDSGKYSRYRNFRSVSFS